MKLKLPHRKPKTETEALENLQHLTKHAEVYRLQQFHHETMVRLHHNQAKMLHKLSTTHPMAASYHEQQNKMAEQHNKLLEGHKKQLIKIKELQHKQQSYLRKHRTHLPKPPIKGKIKARKHKLIALNQSGSYSRILDNKFVTTWVTDSSRGQPELKQQLVNLPNNYIDSDKIRGRLKRNSKALEKFNKAVFKLGTITNLAPDNGAGSDPALQFGVPRSTM